MTNLEATNRSLALLGAAPINYVTDDIQTARVTNRLFETTRKSVLSEFPWSFALRFSSLVPAALSDTKGWSIAYTRPTSAIAIWRVFTDYQEQVQFQAEQNYIYSNAQDATLEYSVDIPFTQWNDASSEAFVFRLAADCAVTLTGSEQISQAMMQKYMAAGNLARRNTRNERDVGTKISGTYVWIRGAGRKIG